MSPRLWRIGAGPAPSGQAAWGRRGQAAPQALARARRQSANAGPRDSNTVSRWRATLPLAVGSLATLALVGGFGAWSVTSRIAGAIVAAGQVEVESNRQVVEHLDGGIVSEILVKDGDRVTAGQVLLRLDGNRPRSELAIVQGQLRDLAARRARLEAERDDRPAIDFSAEVLHWAARYPGYADQVESERQLFRARLQALRQQTDLLREQNKQIGNRIEGTRAQLVAAQRQVALVAAALGIQKKLKAQGLAQAARLLELELSLANQEGQLGQLTAQIAELKCQVTENDISILQLATKRRELAVTQLRDIEARQVELAERQLALEDTLSRLDIRAPVAGIVYGTKVFTVRSVVRPADPLMYVIPQNQPLIVAVRVETTQIDAIHLGQAVTFDFPSFDRQIAQPVSGRIKGISADAMTDPITLKSYYAVTVEPDADSLAKLGGDEKLVPGMPAEAFIQTGAHSPLSYLVRPLAAYFGRAFRS